MPPMPPIGSPPSAAGSEGGSGLSAITTSVVISKEAIETLPIRDVSELYNLQSGVVKIDSKAKGIPDHSEKGLEEVINRLESESAS